MMRAQVIGLTLLFVGLSSAGWAASPYDGSWTVNENCPPTQADVKGYAWTYPGVVRNGALSAQYRVPGGVGSIKLQGRISPIGSAVLNAAGIVGSADYAVGHVGRGTPYHFHVQAQFTESSGTGTRTEQRQCDFTFAKQ
jgi:hypothetical protein